MTNPRRIEEASLNAWPALQQVLYDGWVLRFSDGYTKRANSATPLFRSTMPLESKVETCERIYAGRGLPPIFRLTSLADPEALDLLLEQRGYRKLDPTRVMVLELDGLDPGAGSGVELRADTLNTWLPVFSDLHSTDIERQALHGQILEAIPNPALFATLLKDGREVACGLGVHEEELVGLFDLVTAPDQRRKGYGTKLMHGIHEWAHTQGAVQAYLQVMESNTAACRLYEKEGFSELYHYWYRVPS